MIDYRFWYDLQINNIHKIMAAAGRFWLGWFHIKRMDGESII